MYQCMCGKKEGEGCREVFKTHQEREAHKVHSQSFKGTRRLKLYVTTMTTANVQESFSNLATARVHVVQAFRPGVF